MNALGVLAAVEALGADIALRGRRRWPLDAARRARRARDDRARHRSRID